MGRQGSEPTNPTVEAFLRTALDGTDQIAVVFGAEGRLRWWNAAFEERSGRPASELQGRSATELVERIVAPEDRDRTMAALGRLLETGSATLELTAQTVGGETLPFELRGSSAEVDGETVYLVLGFDIAERREHDRKVEELRSRTLDLMRTTTRSESASIAATAANDIIGAPLSAVFFLDDEGETLVPAAAAHDVTDAFESEPRYHRNDPDGSRGGLVWSVYEEESPVVLEDSRASDVLTEESPARSVIIYPLGDHGVLIASSPEPEVFEDTDEALVEILSAALRASLDRVDRESRLRSQNQRLDEFASILSHDLRNPLNVAEGHLGLAREASDPEPNLDAVERSLERIGSLVEDLLTLAREGKTAVDTQRVDLGDLARSCWMGVETGDAELRVDLTGTVAAEESRLRQLFENLFRNSVEHGSPAGDSVVTVGRLPNDDGFYVADDGVGIPEGEREQVFAAGYSTETDGTGLGLSIVEEVATAHGWSVSVTESEAGGARFEFRGVEWL